MSTSFQSRTAEGESRAKTSLILGVIGLFVFGIVLGPIAIAQASKAESLGASATGGKVLGWIDTGLAVFSIGLAIFFIVSNH